MFRRTLMRWRYNRGHWQHARKHAGKLLENPKEVVLARSVIIRSYWNEGRYQEVLQICNQWPDDALTLYYKERAEDKLIVVSPMKITHRVQRIRDDQPVPKTDINWNESEMVENFSQEGEIVWFRYPGGYVFWEVPKGFDLSSTHENLLKLVAEVLLYPWIPSTRASFTKTRFTGSRASLSFSAGTDSTAAALVMPETTLLGYHRRSFKSLLDHRNANRLLNHLQESRTRDILSISSNHELIRTYYGKQIGFSSDFACASHLILLADHLDLGAIGFGMPLDNTYLWKGHQYRNFESTDYYVKWTKRFQQAGLDLLFPIAAISEAGALKIVQQSDWLEYLNSCMRGDGQNGCGRCWKCFHKNGPLGRTFDIESSEIQVYLNKRPLPTATHALWALQTMNLEKQVPDLAHLFEQDFSWWVQAYPPAFDLLPVPWRKEIQSSIMSFLPTMMEPYVLETINHFNTE